MIDFIAVVHIIFAVALIILVLVQDSKGGGALGIGGGSNSLFGATGAQTLAAKMTRVVAGLLAITCLALTYYAAQTKRSVLDSAPAQAAAPVNGAGMGTTASGPAATGAGTSAPADSATH